MADFLHRIGDIITNEGITIGMMERVIGASKGVLSRALSNGTDIQSKWLLAIVDNYPQYSAEWLLTGKGSMLKKEPQKQQKTLPATTKPKISFNQNEGKPYYDVDFIGGFDEIYNCQTTTPTANIIISGFERADLWCNVTGHSMEPRISHGDIIALRKCTLDDIQYGEMYAAVLDTLRTVKIIRRADTQDCLRFVPINTQDYDEQIYPVSRILQVYEVIGAIKKFF